MLDLEELTVLIEKKEVCTGETWNNIRGKRAIRNFNETENSRKDRESRILKDE